MNVAMTDESNAIFKEYQESTTTTLEWTVRGLRQLFDGSRGEQKSKVHKSVKFGGGRWQILLYPNSGQEGGYVSLYLSCEPTQEEKNGAINGKWHREGRFKFSFDLKTTNKAAPFIFSTKEACDHEFSYKTMNWGWAQFAKRDAVYYSAPTVKQADAFLIICTITSNPVPPTQPSATAKQFVPQGLMDSIGGLLDDPLYSDVEFVIPRRGRHGRGAKRIYANKKLLRRAEYFDDMFRSGFAEGSAGLDNLASPSPQGLEESPMEDSDESDEEAETDVNASMDFGLSLKQPRRANSTNSSSWETQSDGAVIIEGPSSSVPHESGRIEELIQESTNARERGSPSRASTDMETERDQDAENEDVDMEAKGNRNPAIVVRPRLPQESYSDSNVTAKSHPSVPGPSKTVVVVRDVAYATYFAFLYYLYTDSIIFAPLSSSFINGASGTAGRSTQGTPGLNAFGSGNTQSSYFPPAGGAAINSVPSVPRWFGGGGIDDGPPRTRKEWTRQWKAANPNQPPPVSAKAIYRLADKLGLHDLKQRAFQHIVRSLTVNNVPYEAFSAFSACYEEVRKVEIAFLLEKWTQIRSGEAMRNIFQQVRVGRHPGFEEIWPLIVQHLVVKPDADITSVGIGRSASSQGSQAAMEGLRPTGQET